MPPRPSPGKLTSGHRTPPGKTCLCGWIIGLPGYLAISEILVKASQWLSLRHFTRDLLSFHFWGGCSPWETSRPAASSSSALEVVASWSDEGCCHLLLDGGTSILETVDGEAATGGSLHTVVNQGVVASMVASGMLSVRSSMEYISAP